MVLSSLRDNMKKYMFRIKRTDLVLIYEVSHMHNQINNLNK